LAEGETGSFSGVNSTTCWTTGEEGSLFTVGFLFRCFKNADSLTPYTRRRCRKPNGKNPYNSVLQKVDFLKLIEEQVRKAGSHLDMDEVVSGKVGFHLF
jgi:hypothetical protein